jgi:hypothetical protein
MGNYGSTLAGPQPDGTQGLAKVDFKDEAGKVLKTLVGCVICVSSQDHMNFLEITDSESKGKHFVLIPWFEDIRPPDESTPHSVKVSIHRYTKRFLCKEFDVPYDQKEIDKYHQKPFCVLQCKKKSFRPSSFLNKWSSRILLCYDLSHIKVTKQESHGKDTHYKLVGLKKNSVQSSSAESVQEFFYQGNNGRWTCCGCKRISHAGRTWCSYDS